MFRIPIFAAALTLAPLLSVMTAPTAQAGVIFSDGFESDALGLNAPSLTNFTINSGAVDVIGDGFYDYYPGNGHYLDLDGSASIGSENPASDISTKMLFGPGTYTVSFSLAGNATGAPEKTTEVLFGNYSQSIPLLSSQGFGTYSFTTTLTADSSLEFIELGANDNFGNKLDNVMISTAVGTVPLPASAPMFGAALLALGAVGYGLKWKGKPAA